MIDEYSNKKAPEFVTQNENKTIRENVVISENKTVLENVSTDESKDFTSTKQPEVRSKEKARNRAMAALTSSVVGVIGLVVAGMTNLLNVKMKAEFNEVEYRDGTIFYSINVSDITEKEYLIVYPERDGKKLDPIKLVDDDGDGVINGEFPVDKEYIEKQMSMHDNINIKYVLNLRGLVGLDVERLFDRYVVRIDKFTSVFHNVTGHCECGVDGHYYFTMDFEDDGGLFKDFEAYIIDDFYEDASLEEKSEHISYCTFSDNLHDEQRIFVSNLKGSNGRLFIKYLADGVEETVKDPTDGAPGIRITM